VSVEERLARLRDIRLFAGLGEDVVQRVLAVSTELECPAGQVLARANDPGAGMFILEEGTVEVEGRGRTIELGPGEFFGELSLLVPGSRRVARVRAKTPIRCIAINRLDFEELLDDEPRLALAMLPVVAERLWRVMHDDA
jgi:CRP-like cAMP-binding protein